VVVTALTPYEQVRVQVHAALNARDYDTADLRVMIEGLVEGYQRSASTGLEGRVPFTNPDDIVDRLMREVEGIGWEVEALAADDDVEEIYGRDALLSYRVTSGEVKAVATPVSAESSLTVVQRLVAAAGEQLDSSHPRADGVRVILPNGRQARLSASIPPRIDGTVAFVLRLPQKRHVTLDELVAWGSLTAPAANLLRILMLVTRSKLLVVGPPGAGKNSLIDALLRAVPARRRTIVIEDERELTAPLLNGEYWATSPVEDMVDLIRSARVGSPELIVLGEVKGGEAFHLCMAGNLGTGVMAAVHADSTAKAFDALADAASLAMPAMTTPVLREKFSRTFEVVVYCGMETVGDKAIRQITDISVVPAQISASMVAVTPIFKRDAVGEALEMRSTDLGADLEDRCNRVLRDRCPAMTITEVLQGSEVTL
jgi:pilus assembly protein CpaF